MKVAIVGASGAVGQEFLKILAERRFPVDELLLFGSARSTGRSYGFRGDEVVVRELGNPEDFRGIDLVLVSAGGSVSHAFAETITRYGAVMIDNSSAFRMESDVPLVVPEVNGADALQMPRRIVANPNCTTIQLVMVLQALEGISHIRRVQVATYQSASGAGTAAMDELQMQHACCARGETPIAERFAYQLAYNLIPQVDSFGPDDYTKEEWKMYHETRKIMHSDIQVSATCVRVPVLRAHSEAIWVETERPVSVDEAREAFRCAPGVVLLDDPQAKLYPMPLQLSGKDSVYVGRLRRDIANPNGLTLWSVSDQIRKGAALNAVQIAEYLLSQSRLKR